jgi:3-methyladenine DNA glycosylase AlkD
MKSRKHLSVAEFVNILTSLNQGDSSTEKCMAGILLDYCSDEQCAFDPEIFDSWLNNLVGWAEVDTICTGSYLVRVIPENWSTWKRLLVKFSKSKNINKRRASMVLLISPIRSVKDDRLLLAAFGLIETLKAEKDILITKAISWLLRSMAKHHKDEVFKFVKANMDTLPSIAVRETLVKLKTGRKSG